MLLLTKQFTYANALFAAESAENRDKAHQYLIVYCDREGNPLPITRKRNVQCYRLRKVAR